jgi:hypothetical protein
MDCKSIGFGLRWFEPTPAHLELRIGGCGLRIEEKKWLLFFWEIRNLKSEIRNGDAGIAQW